MTVRAIATAVGQTALRGRVFWMQWCPKFGKEVDVTVHVGDRIKIESERAGQSGRAGLIEEVLSEQPQRLRVRWEDGARVSSRRRLGSHASSPPPVHAGGSQRPRSGKGAADHRLDGEWVAPSCRSTDPYRHGGAIGKLGRLLVRTTTRTAEVAKAKPRAATSRAYSWMTRDIAIVRSTLPPPMTRARIGRSKRRMPSGSCTDAQIGSERQGEKAF